MISERIEGMAGRLRQAAYLVGALAMTAAISGCVTAGGAAARKPIEVIAHRGASAYAPENTMAAFRLAHEMGADWFELDCTLTKDGQIIVIHDDTIDRTTTGKGSVADLTLSELKNYDAGSWKDTRFEGERLPTLSESLDFAKGRIGVYIEVKSCADDRELINEILDMAADYPACEPALAKEIMARIEASGSKNLELVRKVIALVKQRRMQKEVVIQSFSSIVCAVTAIEAPELRVELLAGVDPPDLAAWESALRWTFLFGLDGLNVNREAVTPGRLGLMHAAGKTVAVWTVNATPEMRRFAAWGVDRIITDRPDACLEVLRDMGIR